MKTLVFLWGLLLCFAAACGSSDGETKPAETAALVATETLLPAPGIAKGPGVTRPAASLPQATTALPEGHVVILQYGYATSDDDDLHMYLLGQDGAEVIGRSYVSLSPDGEYAAYVEPLGESETPASPSTLIVRRLSGDVVVRYALPRSYSSGLVWAPSGSQLAFEIDQTVYVVSPDGTVLTHAAPPDVWGWDLEWQDSERLLMTAVRHGEEDRSGSFSMDASTGEWKQLELPQGAQSISFSPSGQYYTYGTPPDPTSPSGCYSSCHLWVRPASTGAEPCSIMANAYSHGQESQVPRWSSDGLWVAYFASYDRAIGRGQLHVYDPVTCKDYATMNDVNNYRWSPAEATLAVTIKDEETFASRLALWKPVDGLQQPLDVQVSWPQVWSPDGTTVATVTEGGVLLVAGASGTATEIHLPDPTDHTDKPDLAWSPSGRYVLASYSLSFRGEPSGTWMYIVDTETGTVSEFLRHPTELHQLSWVT